MLTALGKYLILMWEVVQVPDKMKMFWSRLINEFQNLGVDSVGLVAIISIFMGAVAAMQVAFNIDNPLIPAITVGFTVRQSIILEFSPTVISLILAGKVGSSIASEIGTMRVTEQIDALQIMGVKAANFLLLPKLTAALIYFPVLIVISIFLGIAGGWVAVITMNLVSSQDYLTGLQSWYDPWTVSYALIKTVIFAFIIVTVSGYQGYTIKGGALDVGNASTRAVVNSSILIILFNLLLTETLL